MTIGWGTTQQFQTCLDTTVRELLPHTGEFNWIVARGMSGCILGLPVAHALNKTLFIVRKPEDRHYPQHTLIGDKLVGPGLFLDDFITAAKTFVACHGAVADQGEQHRWDAREKKYDKYYGAGWYTRNYGPRPDDNTLRITCMYLYSTESFKTVQDCSIQAVKDCFTAKEVKSPVREAGGRFMAVT